MTKNHTLQLRKPIGWTLILTLMILPLLFIAFEGLLRIEFLKPRLNELVPSLGSRHHQLELQLARLDYFVAREGKVDCIFLGSSLVWLGYNPDVFEEVVQQETGRKINCFNLGIEALPASAAGVLAEIIIEEYHPWLLIYGTSARDYAPALSAEEMSVILDTPWIQYKSGHRTLLGWLYTHSYIFRYADQIHDLLRINFDFRHEIAANQNDLNGFLPKTRPAQEIHYQVAAEVAAQYFQPYIIRPENIQGLRQVLDQQNQDTQVVVVEMPVQQNYYAYFSNDKQDYDRFSEEVSRIVIKGEGIIFLPASPASIIPEEGWWDWSHMNRIGAEIFSQWLGQQILQTPVAENRHLSETPTSSK